MKNEKKFLVIDDDADDCYFFCEAIRKIDASAECITAANGEDALMKLRTATKQLPDLIFLDLNMHLMDGRVCLAELKKDDSLKHIPVIILTTSSSEKDMTETSQLGAVHYITKPTEAHKLQQDLFFSIQNYIV